MGRDRAPKVSMRSVEKYQARGKVPMEETTVLRLASFATEQFCVQHCIIYKQVCHLRLPVPNKTAAFHKEYTGGIVDP